MQRRMLLIAPACALLGHSGSAVQRSPQRDEVGVSCRKDVLSHLGLADDTHGDHWDGDCLPDLPWHEDAPGLWIGHRLQALLLAPETEIGVDSICSRTLHAVSQPASVFQCETAFHHVLGHQAHHNRIVATHVVFDSFDNLDQEACTAFETAPVLVLAVVCQRGEELVDEQPVAGLKFHRVETGLFGPPRSFHEFVDHSTDFVEGEFSGDDTIFGSRHGRWRHRGLPFDIAKAGIHPGMGEFHGGQRTAIVDRLSQSAQPRDEQIIVDAWLCRTVTGQWICDTHILHNDHPDASHGPLGVVVNQLLANTAILGSEIAGDRRHNESIL